MQHIDFSRVMQGARVRVSGQDVPRVSIIDLTLAVMKRRSHNRDSRRVIEQVQRMGIFSLYKFPGNRTETIVLSPKFAIQFLDDLPAACKEAQVACPSQWDLITAKDILNLRIEDIVEPVGGLSDLVGKRECLRKELDAIEIQFGREQSRKELELRGCRVEWEKIQREMELKDIQLSIDIIDLEDRPESP